LPNVFVNATESVASSSRRFNPKWIFIILGIVVVVELIFGIQSLRQAPTASTQPSRPTTVTKPSVGRIALLGNQSVKVGDKVMVSVEVNSPAPAEGVDVVVKFDTKALQVTDSDIQAGKIFPKFPVAKVDPGGIIRISGIATPGNKGFSGKGILANINFKAISPGKTTVSLDFTKGSTADSNIVSGLSATDLLEEVQNLEVTVR